MAIKFEQVGYDYISSSGERMTAIEDINLSIKGKGEFIALIGETGSGKSTLVQHMNALLKPQRGTVTVYGVSIMQTKKKKYKKRRKQNLNPLRQKVGLVFQFPDYQLFEETVERDIMFGPKNFGASEKEAKERAKKALQLVGLPTHYLQRSPFNLSGGEKKRVSIAGILAMEPDILVLDEPTSGLDPKGRDDLLELFMEIHKKEGKTIILITHDMNIVYKYASRVLVMNKSRLVYDGDVLSLFASGNLSKWNLEGPDLLTLTKKLASEFNISLYPLPKNLDELYDRVREAIS